MNANRKLCEAKKIAVECDNREMRVFDRDTRDTRAKKGKKPNCTVIAANLAQISQQKKLQWMTQNTVQNIYGNKMNPLKAKDKAT